MWTMLPSHSWKSTCLCILVLKWKPCATLLSTTDTVLLDILRNLTVELNEMKLYIAKPSLSSLQELIVVLCSTGQVLIFQTPFSISRKLLHIPSNITHIYWDKVSRCKAELGLELGAILHMSWCWITGVCHHTWPIVGTICPFILVILGKTSITLFYCIYLLVCVWGCVCHRMCMKVRKQFAGIGPLLLPCGSRA